MRIGRRSVAALLCLLMCLSFVNWNPAKAAAEDDVAAPAETGEPAPESAPQNEAEAKDQAAPAPETPAPEEDDPSTPAEAPAEPEAKEPADAPETQETAEEPADEEPEEEPAGEPGGGEDSVVPASLEAPVETQDQVLLDAGKGRFKSGENKMTVTLTDHKLPADQEEPACEGWNFVGWYDQNPTYVVVDGKFVETQKNGMKYEAGVTEIQEAVKVLYAAFEPIPGYVPPKGPRTVVLDAVDGDFKDVLPEQSDGGNNNYTRTVTLTEEGLFPQDAPTPKWGSAEFAGWYVKKPKVVQVPDEGQDVNTWHWEVQTEGEKIQAGDPVPEGVDRLYAAYTLAQDSKITVYYDYNGIKGMYGHCLTAVRPAGSTFGDDIIFNFNYPSGANDPAGVLGLLEAGDYAQVRKNLDAYWAENPIDGEYYFEGWYTAQIGGSRVDHTTALTNGATFYAHWHKADGSTHETFQREEPKPAKGIFFTGTDFTRLRAHPGSSATVEVQFDPIGSSADITWTAFVYIAKEELTPEDLKELVASSLRPDKNKPSIPTLTLTRTDGGSVSNDDVTLTENGRQLTVRCNKEAFVYISASVTLPEENGGGSQVCQTPVDARITFSHSWVKTGEEQLPTCTEPGYANYKCSDPSCHETHQVVWPANGHRYKIVSKSGTGSDLTWVKECVECKATLSESNLSPIDMRNPDKVTSARTVAEIKELYGNNVGGTTVYVYGKDGSQITRSDALVGTGCTIKLQDASGRITDVPVAVAGDVDGNGTIDSADAKQINESVCGLRSLTGSYIDAAKVTAGAEITAGDVVAVLDLIAK